MATMKDIARMAQLAVTTLLQGIKTPKESHRTLTLKPELILRQSILTK